VIQPGSIRADDFAGRLRELDPDFLVVIAFGHILPEKILALPRMGAINIHASLLPCYRGPAPIQWAIINGEKETGVTAMMMDKGMDTGDILATSKIDISPEDTSASLHDRLASLSADLLIRVLNRFKTGKIAPTPQNHSEATYAPLLKKKDGRIDWKKPAGGIDAFIRGVSPWPGAFTFQGEKRLKILAAKSVFRQVDVPHGTVLKAFPDELWVATGNGVLSILEIQSSSGKRLRVADFLRGHEIAPGTILD
jgi:methionyl-tRNA formyltransferase